MPFRMMKQACGNTPSPVMLAIATCNYPASHPDCNGHSTLFDGVVYLPELSGSRDTCVFEAEEGEEHGKDYQLLDVKLLLGG